MNEQDKEQLYKDMAWEMARELGGLLSKPVTDDTLYAVEGIIENVGTSYSESYSIQFGAKMLSLVSISCNAQKNTVDVSWLSPQKAYERNILDKEEMKEYNSFLNVNKFKIEED